jgi:hypothetical protein
MGKKEKKNERSYFIITLFALSTNTLCGGTNAASRGNQVILEKYDSLRVGNED